MKNLIFLCGLFIVLFLTGCQKSSEIILDEAMSSYELPATLENSLELKTSIDFDGQIIEIEWSSTNQSIIDDHGNIFRTDVDQEVVLTARFTYMDIHKEKQFTVLVLAVDSQTVAIRTYSNPDELFKIYYFNILESMPVLDIPEHDQATFMNWCSDASLTEDFNESTPITQNIDLYAKWDVDNYQFEVVYTGFKSDTIEVSLHIQQVLLLDSYLTFFEDADIVSIGYGNPQTSTFTFNKYQLKHKVYVETKEKMLTLRSYEQQEEVWFDQIYVDQVDLNTIYQYGITSDDHLYFITQEAFESVYVDLGQIDLQDGDVIKELHTSNQYVYLSTEQGYIYILSNHFNMMGSHSIDIKIIDPTLYRMGALIDLKINDQVFHSVIAYYEQGTIDLSEPDKLPSFFYLESPQDQIKDVLNMYQDIFVLTENHQIYHTRKWFSEPLDSYGNITSFFDLDEGELFEHIVKVSNYVYFVTSKNRAFHYATYSDDLNIETTYTFSDSYSLKISTDEHILWIQGNMVFTDQHHIYKLSLENGLSSPVISAPERLTLPLVDGDTVVNHFPATNNSGTTPELFITEKGHVILYHRYNRVYQRIKNLILGEDEEILSYYLFDLEKHGFNILTTKDLYIGQNGAVDSSLHSWVTTAIGELSLYQMTYDGQNFRAVTQDGKIYLYYEDETLLRSELSYWKEKESITLSYEDQIQLTIDKSDPLFDQFWSVSPLSVSDIPDVITSDINVYLHEIPKAFEVTFETGYDIDLPALILNENQMILLPEPAIDNKVFVGWYLDQNLTIPYQNTMLELGKTHTVYARWADPFYSVLYHDVEDAIAPTSCPSGSIPEITSVIPQKAGYEFNGWYDASGQRYIVKDEPLYDDLHLYARFIPIPIRIQMVDQNHNSYEIVADYDQSLVDIKDKLYGYKITSFYEDEQMTILLDMQTLLHSDDIFYVIIAPVDVTLVILEEIVATYDVDYRMFDGILFAQYDNQLYIYSGVDQLVFNQDKFIIRQPVNITSLISIQSFDQIVASKNMGQYLLLITADHRVWLIDHIEMKVIYSVILHLETDEVIDADSISYLHYADLDSFYFFFITSENKLYTFDMLGNFLIEANVTRIFQMSSRVIIVLVDDEPVGYSIGEEGLNHEKKLYQLLNQEPVVQLMSRFVYRQQYIEVYEDGSYLIFEYRREDGKSIFTVTLDDISLQESESIQDIYQTLIYTSQGRIIPVGSYNVWEMFDFSNTFEVGEKIASVNGSDIMNSYIITSNHRLITTRSFQAPLQLESGESVIGLLHENVVTNKRMYSYDFILNEWKQKNFLSEGESMISMIGDKVLTSESRVLNLMYESNHESFSMMFRRYQIREVIVSSYKENPNLDAFVSDESFVGWYLEYDLIAEFEGINQVETMVLYPRYE